MTRVYNGRINRCLLRDLKKTFPNVGKMSSKNISMRLEGWKTVHNPPNDFLFNSIFDYINQNGHFPENSEFLFMQKIAEDERISMLPKGMSSTFRTKGFTYSIVLREILEFSEEILEKYREINPSLINSSIPTVESSLNISTEKVDFTIFYNNIHPSIDCSDYSLIADVKCGSHYAKYSFYYDKTHNPRLEILGIDNDPCVYDIPELNKHLGIIHQELIALAKQINIACLSELECSCKEDFERIYIKDMLKVQ